MPIVYSPRYEVDLGKHIFPSRKYRLIKERLIAERAAQESDFAAPGQATDDEMLLVHTREYLDKVRNISLSKEELLRLEFPLSREIADFSFLYCGGTILAARHALERGMGIHDGGGFHNAFPDHGEGFCIFNDIAVAVKVLQKEGKIGRAMVIDCDIHQGCGLASIFSDDPSVFTFTIYQESIYPKSPILGDRAIGLKPGTRDQEYLAHIRINVPAAIEKHRPEIIMYNAGNDTFFGDQIGGFELTEKGLRERDLVIRHFACKYGIPVVVTLAGGYAPDVNQTAALHAATLKAFLGKM